MWYIGQSLIAIDERACRLSWGKSDASDLEGYNVYMSLSGDASDFERVNATVIPTEEWMSPPLRNDRIYYFYITAIDVSGNESEKSNILAFKLSDYREDEVIEVYLEDKTLESNASFLDEPTTHNFLTKFELDSTYLKTGDVLISIGEESYENIQSKAFSTRFILGG